VTEPSRTLRFADVFPDRVNPLDDPEYLARYIASRAADDTDFRTADEAAHPIKEAA